MMDKNNANKSECMDLNAHIHRMKDCQGKYSVWNDTVDRISLLWKNYPKVSLHNVMEGKSGLVYNDNHYISR